jgi:mono/diheme cytochrome c family protein
MRMLVLGAAIVSMVALSEGRPAALQGTAAAAVKNPVASTPQSLAAGKQSYTKSCGSCHGLSGTGGEPPEESLDPGPPPPNLVDGSWDHGSTDGEIFANIKSGIPNTNPEYSLNKKYMEPWGDRLTDQEIWNIVNFIRSLEKETLQNRGGR